LKITKEFNITIKRILINYYNIVYFNFVGFLERVVLNLQNTVNKNIKFYGMCQICWRGQAEFCK